MHRHSYKGRKFGREKDERRALIRALLVALFTHQEITTTTARAKEIRRMAEKLISIAKRGGLANRRLLISRLDDIETADLLMDVVVPQIKRDSGYLTIKAAGLRRGDNSEMSTIGFVDTIDFTKKDKKAAKEAKKPATKEAKPAAKAATKATPKKAAKKVEDKEKK